MPIRDVEERRAYQRAWVRRRRAEYFADKCCARCGRMDHLELDHKDPSEKVSHNIWSWSRERREAELAKCQVLCEDCHQEKTDEDLRQMFGELKHGTVSAYRRYGCRCVACKKAEARYKKYRRSGVAQSVERSPVKREDGGPNPSPGANL